MATTASSWSRLKSLDLRTSPCIKLTTAPSEAAGECGAGETRDKREEDGGGEEWPCQQEGMGCKEDINLHDGNAGLLALGEAFSHSGRQTPLPCSAPCPPQGA